ncbi:FAD-dependent oxidoreductase [Pontixanthobacter luteolus]|uniref:FAD-dependent oxidoreductase n=1 Tax=Pontixanthobacter luteolus TaxID=295089 RepID=UPI00230305B3|nr:FAD-dependent oxidoreductase [Pontixanthobacter luteolus]
MTDETVVKTSKTMPAKSGKAAKKAAPKRAARTPNAKPAKAKAKAAKGKSVAVVGGGIAGLTSAIKLLKAGFEVTIFEQNERLGGNTSSELVAGVEHDVYPHMFCDWYDNFWDLYENDLDLSRDDHFEPRAGVKTLREGSKTYDELLNPTTLQAIIANLKSGSLSPAEMFLMGYSMVDLAGYPFDREGMAQLEKQSVNGFLYSTSYATEEVAELENYMLEVIWSINSERTSAASYQDFIRHTLSFPNGAPFAFMLKNDLNTGLVQPIADLIAQMKGTVKTSTEVIAVRLVDDRPVLHWRSAGSSGRGSSGGFDEVVIAVPCAPLTDLVMGGTRNLAGDRLIDREQSLAQVRRLSSVAIPVIDLYLNRKLPDIPPENIGLTGAKYGLSVVDIAQLWPEGEFGGNTALVIAASDGEALPGHNFEAQAWFMLQELRKFYPGIDIGTKWGDPDCDIDWAKTHARSNTDYALFLNEVGGWDWRPCTAYPGTLPGIFFAGDLAQSNVDMATIEGAVESGVLAAAAVQAFDAERTGQMRGKPIELIKHLTYGNTALRAAKLALMPFAYLAKGWTLLEGSAPKPDLKYLGNSLQSDHLPLLPLQYIVDWWTTAYWFWNSALTGDEGPEKIGPRNNGDDDFIGLGAALLMVAGEFASYATEKCAEGRAEGAEGKSRSAVKDGSDEGLDGLARRAGRMTADFLSCTGSPAQPDPTPRQRRWRVKR